jgi:hypothetical protein
MTQRQLDRSVARATGESVDFIRQFGFSEMPMPVVVPSRRAARQIIVRTRDDRRRPNRERELERKAA